MASRRYSSPPDKFAYYFFVPDRSSNWTAQPSWFDILGLREASTPAEIRLAYRVRTLELQGGFL